MFLLVFTWKRRHSGGIAALQQKAAEKRSHSA
jgi:hypothetical protein